MNIPNLANYITATSGNKPIIITSINDANVGNVNGYIFDNPHMNVDVAGNTYNINNIYAVSGVIYDPSGLTLNSWY